MFGVNVRVEVHLCRFNSMKGIKIRARPLTSFAIVKGLVSIGFPNLVSESWMVKPLKFIR